MATLYFHIPFCKRICSYCDFYKVGAMEFMPSVIEMMHRELEERANYLKERELSSIYFGGGTPSLLPPGEIERLTEHARRLFATSHVEEITLEANPDDITEEYARALADTSIDRVSLGVQSFDDGVLSFMNRRHTARDAHQAIERLRRYGFKNISIDIIFGVGGFGSDWLRRTLDEAVATGAEHISAYHLTVEERTRLGLMVRRGEYKPVDEEQSEADYRLVESVLQRAGYEHYEVSNYARAGYRAKHNSAYWRGVEYLGIGPGAHSFSGDDRRWLISSVKEYAQGNMVFDSETLGSVEHLNEYVMTSLRCVEGLDLDYVAKHYGAEQAERIERESRSWMQAGVVVRSGSRLAIPTSKFMLSDAVIETLFV